MSLIAIAPDTFARGVSADNPKPEPVYVVRELTEALLGTYQTDAHLVAYVVPAATKQPRINKGGLSLVEIEPLLGVLFADVDNPDHAPWDEDSIAATVASLDANPDLSSAGYYLTKHGYRIVQPIEEPIRASEAEPYLLGWLQHLQQRGIKVDMACKDWTRHYRLPNVMRDGAAYYSPCISLSHMAPIPRPTPVYAEPASPAPLARRADRGSAYDRAREYAARVPGAVQGSHGDEATFKLACALVRGFDLPDQDALALLQEWNTACSPPWSETALRTKIRSARANGRGAFGELLDTPRARTAPPRDDDSWGPLPDEPPHWIDTVQEPVPDDIQVWTPTQSYLGLVEILDRDAGKLVKQDDSKTRLNLMTGDIEIGSVIVDDELIGELRYAIEANYTITVHRKTGDVEKRLQFSADETHRALKQVAKRHCYHPVEVYLRGLAWDGVPRIDAMPRDALGVQDPRPEEILAWRWWLLQAARRGIEPACQADYVLVLIGQQGVCKSTLLDVLGGSSRGHRWTTSAPVGTDNEASMLLRQAWIVEWSELAGIGRRSVEEVKGFLTKRVDTYRPKYGLVVKQYPRRCVVAATTNDEQFLIDATGNRRFWPVVVGEIDVEYVAKNRDQIWAEATAAILRGERCWPDAEDELTFAVWRERHVIEDAWTEHVAVWAEGRDSFTTSDAILGISRADRDPASITHGDRARMSALLKRMGYQQGNSRRGKGVVKVWKAKM